MNAPMSGVRTGSTKIIRPMRPGVVSFEFLDTFSVFDVGSHHQTIPGKGAANCACAVRSFEIARAAGIPTHFIKQVNAATILVEEYATPEGVLSGRTHGRVLPLEWIWRKYLLGSLERKVRAALEYAGVKPDSIFRSGMELPGTLLNETTKFEEVDRDVRESEACELAGIDYPHFVEIRHAVLTLTRKLHKAFADCGILSADGKFEIALRDDGTVVFVDVFGTPDENRLLIGDHRGRPQHHDKEFLRQFFIDIGYKKAVDVARTKGSEVPPYPDLPDGVIKAASERFKEVARRYAAT